MSEQSSIISREELAIEEVVDEEEIYVVKPVVVSAGWLVDEEVVVQESEVEVGKGQVVEGELGELETEMQVKDELGTAVLG